MTGKIITIEGLDGSGKSTQISLLREKLFGLGINHEFIHFPMLNKGFYGKLIAEYLRGEFGAVENVHPKLAALLFAEDRNENKTQLQSWLQKGYLIILDRYVNSNIAFQCAKTDNLFQKNQLKQWITDFEFVHNNLPKPNISFFLNVPINYIENSLTKVRTGSDRDYLNGQTDIHENSLDLQKKVQIEYMQLIQEQKDFHEIRCFTNYNNWLTPRDIHEAIFSKIQILIS